MIIRCLKISRSHWIFYSATRVSSNRLESPNTLEFKCKSSKRIHKNTYSIETLLKENVFLAWLASWNRPISRFFFIFLTSTTLWSRYILGITCYVFNIQLKFFSCIADNNQFPFTWMLLMIKMIMRYL